MKRLWRSKTIGVNIFVIIAVYLLSKNSPEFNQAMCGNSDFILYALAGINMLLRTLTKEGVTMKKDILSLFFVLLLSGCGGADIELRNDPSPSPMDENYHTMLMQSTCSPELSMGQAGCSLSQDDDLSKISFSILSPLGGSLLIYSRECGVDRKDYLEKGAQVIFKLSELIPPNTEFCTFSLFTYWEKPKEIKTDVPVRGQSGKFYVRIRPKGSSPAKLTWTPQQGMEKINSGITFAQFREFVNPIGPGREPILLNIDTTELVPHGKYQLWSEAKQVGIKTTPFSGNRISINRDQILGPAKKGSFILAGWAVTPTGSSTQLDNDFIVAVDIFGFRAPKLSGSLTFTDTEVCYKTEATVSLVLISGIDKASNKVEGCFPKPPGDAVMAFYSNVGRAAYAIIKNGGYTWIQ